MHGSLGMVLFAESLHHATGGSTRREVCALAGSTRDRDWIPKRKLLPLVCLMVAVMFSPLMVPTNVQFPGCPVATKDPDRMVKVKPPIWSVTGVVGGLIPLLLAPSVKLALIENCDWTG
jgi:hypothetical protein